MTAIANDYSYDEVFSRQIEAMVSRPDIAIGISTSGNARNIIQALKEARKKGLTTVGSTGSGGGGLLLLHSLRPDSSHPGGACSSGISCARSLKRILQMSGIFLDRDGVIIRKAAEGEYITNTAEMEFLPGSAEAIAKLSRSGFKIIVATNQRGIAIGKIKLPALEDIHARLRQVVEDLGGEICDVFYCPHDISEDCRCRKPKAGMLLQAAKKHQLRLSECWLVGDMETDIAAGKNAGCKTALITQSRVLTWAYQPDMLIESLASFAERILCFASTKTPQSV